MKIPKLGKHQIVLMGMGHTNAHFARMWKMKRIPNAELTCISDRPIATYSGMLPAALAGQITPSQMEIDLVRFCASVNARLIVGKVTGIDRVKSELLIKDRPAIPFDILSIGIGSVPTVASLEHAESEEHLLKIKPMQTFLQRLGEKIRGWQNSETKRPEAKLRISVVGSGIAGLEILFCLEPYLRNLGVTNFQLSLVTRSKRIFSDGQENTRRKLEQEILARGHNILCDKTVVKVTAETLQFSDTSKQPSDLVIWATGATAPPSLQHLGLPTDERGFLPTESTLLVRDEADRKSANNARIFAVGDTGTISGTPHPKAGVYAVRQGPILWKNIQRAIAGQELQAYHPQRSFLSLINLGDDRAIGQWKGFTFIGKWAYRLKHRIDSKFMEQFEPIPMTSDDPDDAMQCHGCGCKFSSTSLDTVLSTAAPENDIVADDAARVGGSTNPALYASTDFFTNPVDDAYLFGRLTALHSASDLIATGVGITEALANVVLQEGDSRTQEHVLSDFMAGAAREFSALGAKIVGGHTIVGPRMEAGFTVIGSPWQKQVLAKSGLRTGDRLYLTKPLGIGVLLAAHMRSLCPADAYFDLLRWMLSPQQHFAQTASEAGLQAATDVTGFGLMGHLLEMLHASQVAAQLDLSSIPFLDAAVALSSIGVSSSLLPSNMWQSAQVHADEKIKADVRYPLLFDPQTCGGLLLGIPEKAEAGFLDRLEEASLGTPFRIGEIVLDDKECKVQLSDRN